MHRHPETSSHCLQKKSNQILKVCKRCSQCPPPTPCASVKVNFLQFFQNVLSLLISKPSCTPSLCGEHYFTSNPSPIFFFWIIRHHLLGLSSSTFLTPTPHPQVKPGAPVMYCFSQSSQIKEQTVESSIVLALTGLGVPYARDSTCSSDQ